FPVAVADMDAARSFLKVDVRVACRQHHAMVQLVGNGLGAVLQGNEVEDVLVLIQFAFDFNGGPVIVAVQSFAPVAFLADKMAAAKDEVVFGDPDFVALGHNGKSAVQGIAGGRVILPSRSATNKQAVTRSAVVPGLRLCSSARSQASNATSVSRLTAVCG